MLYTIKNCGTNPRLVYSSRSRAEPFQPGEERQVHLPDGTAILVRRCQLRGDKLEIMSTTPDGEAVLEKATIPLPRRGRSLLGPPKLKAPEEKAFIDEFVGAEPAQTPPPPVIEEPETAEENLVIGEPELVDAAPRRGRRR